MHRLIKRFISTSVTGTLLSNLDYYIANVKDLLLKGLNGKAVKLYAEHVHPVFPSHESAVFILPSIIKACAHSQTHKSLAHLLHSSTLKNGFDSECTVSNSLISHYSKFSDTKNAYKVFETMPQRDTISWSSMINCYIQNGMFLESIKLFKDMYECGFVPKPELIAAVLSACVQMENFDLGKSIHALVIVDQRLKSSVFLSTALVDLYFKCHDSIMAFRVFDRMEVRNEVSWTAMIAGFVADHEFSNAMGCFRAMQVENIKPNRATLMSILPAFADFSFLKHVKEMHGYAIRNYFDWDFRFSSALIHMYCEIGTELRAAKLIFERSPRKDIVMWSCMIKGYSRSENNAEEALNLFNEMQREGIQPNSITLLAVISACTILFSVHHSRGVHGYVVKSCLIADLNVQNSLISMYAKCGFLSDSVQIFEEMLLRDSISWSAIISAYSLYGYGKKALQLFHEMQLQGTKADGVTILEVLTACNHAGLIEEGKGVFNEAMEDDKINSSVEHYACYIDLLGKAGKLEDACDVVSQMAFEPSTKIWSCLVSACKFHGRLEVAQVLAQRLIKLEPENAAYYTLLSMIYAESDNWLAVEKVRRSMKQRKLLKNYGFSKI
ncbi:hypothetical protein M9H77_27912 [Catharanthus roseus]|uniref:Uncharacterized protein n=1 Tax=Catharanthus roseus TaxID=4058 RepID=A0ACC0AER0_CATRO|nr:hypothetical protein M9H77_27912 [Catharanthus roseus]